MYFRTLVLSALVIAVFAGAVISLYQAYFITPLILGSEVFEVAEPAGHHQQIEEIEAWAPEDGIERNSWNFTSNFFLCFAYALILLSAMSINATATTLKGVLWGLAAYLAIFAAPALGLPPEIPGMEAAQLEGRQAWWLLTVILTAISLWMIAFQTYHFKVVGLVIMLLPHLLGAPQPEHHGFANTDPTAITELTQLWHHFVIQTSIANALLWIVIGALAGFLTKKYIYPIAKSGNNYV